jgi:hypothetical protein
MFATFSYHFMFSFSSHILILKKLPLPCLEVFYSEDVIFYKLVFFGFVKLIGHCEQNLIQQIAIVICHSWVKPLLKLAFVNRVKCRDRTAFFNPVQLVGQPIVSCIQTCDYWTNGWMKGWMKQTLLNHPTVRPAVASCTTRCPTGWMISANEQSSADQSTMRSRWRRTDDINIVCTAEEIKRLIDIFRKHWVLWRVSRSDYI